MLSTEYDFISIAMVLALSLPLLNFIIINLLKEKLPKNAVIAFGIGIMIIASITFDFAVYDFYNGNAVPNTVVLWHWLKIGDYLNVDLTAHMDMLTAVLCTLVINVSTLVHIYSIGYMSHDKNQEKFISYLSLFTFFMLILVMSNNFLQLFVGWEGVGLCSYLLIGFWYHKKSANDAAIKAFLVNRIADIGIILGMAVTLFSFGSLEFKTVLDIQNITNVMQDGYYNVLGYNFTTIDFICLLFFLGCMGKSAQIFLHVWLPDAMEGPTPVSALIHAATMVTAGVFFIARCSPLFEHSEITLKCIVIIGGLTAIFAATVAVVQQDIKRIIAYSTCSQLGYMMFACGLSAYAQGIFHLFTHGFFKALLFLSAGSVIHGIHDEQNIFKMGRLAKYMPFTYGVMLVGSLSLAGIFPFAGFYSKDAIIETAHFAGTFYGNFAYYIGLAAAFLTSFYSWRLIIIVFEKPKHYEEKPHESAFSMKLPLFILAICTLLVGIVGTNLGMLDKSMNFWHGSIFVSSSHVIEEKHLEFTEKFLPMIVAVAGIILAYIVYYTKPIVVKPIFNLLSHAYYFDRLYNCIFVRGITCAANLSKKIETCVIESSLGLLVSFVKKCYYNISKLHTGNLQDYIAMMFFVITAAFLQLLLDQITDFSNAMFWIIAIWCMVLYLKIVSSNHKLIRKV